MVAINDATKGPDEALPYREVVRQSRLQVRSLAREKML
jgi:hypothetical protein